MDCVLIRMPLFMLGLTIGWMVGATAVRMQLKGWLDEWIKELRKVMEERKQ